MIKLALLVLLLYLHMVLAVRFYVRNRFPTHTYKEPIHGVPLTIQAAPRRFETMLLVNGQGDSFYLFCIVC